MLKLINFKRPENIKGKQKHPICLGHIDDVSTTDVLDALSASSYNKYFYYELVQFKQYVLIETHLISDSNITKLMVGKEKNELYVDIKEQDKNVSCVVNVSKYAPSKIRFVKERLKKIKGISKRFTSKNNRSELARKYHKLVCKPLTLKFPKFTISKQLIGPRDSLVLYQAPLSRNIVSISRKKIADRIKNERPLRIDKEWINRYWINKSNIKQNKIRIVKDYTYIKRPTISSKLFKRYGEKTLYDVYDKSEIQEKLVDWMYDHHNKLKNKGVFKEHAVLYGNESAVKAIKTIYEEQDWEWTQTKNVYCDMNYYPLELNLGYTISQIITMGSLFYKGDDINVCTTIEERDSTYYSAGVIDHKVYEYTYKYNHLLSNEQYMVYIPYHDELFQPYITIRPTGEVKYNRSISKQLKNYKVGYYTDTHMHIYVNGIYSSTIRIDGKKPTKYPYAPSWVVKLCRLCGYTYKYLDMETLDYILNNVEDMLMINSVNSVMDIIKELPEKYAEIVTKTTAKLIAEGKISNVDDVVFYEDSYKDEE